MTVPDNVMIKGLLEEKKLTGREAARLLLTSFREKDHGREPILSQSDIDRIRSWISTQKDIEEYNSWIDAYKLLDCTMREAKSTLEEALRENCEVTIDMITQLLAAEAVFEAFYRLLGVYFIEEVIEWRQKVRQAVTKYNAALMAANINEDGPSLKLPKIKLDELEPDEEWLEYYQERMAMSLPDNWYDMAMGKFEPTR